MVDETKDRSEDLARKLEAELCQAHHYQQARHLDQLGPCRVVKAQNASDLFLEEEQRRGLKLGDIKPLILYHYMPSEAFVEFLQ